MPWLDPAPFLWQGLATGNIAALIIIATRRSNASIRYNLFTGIILLIPALLLSVRSSSNSTELKMQKKEPVSA